MSALLGTHVSPLRFHLAQEPSEPTGSQFLSVRLQRIGSVHFYRLHMQSIVLPSQVSQVQPLRCSDSLRLIARCRRSAKIEGLRSSTRPEEFDILGFF